METKHEMEYKQVIVIRTDLGMSVGKIAAQASHVAVLAAEMARINDHETWKSWLNEGYKKIVCQVSSEQEIIDLVSASVIRNLPFALTHDFGLTEVVEGTLTAAAIGPGKNSAMNSVTGRLKLLK